MDNYPDGVWEGTPGAPWNPAPPSDDPDPVRYLVSLTITRVGKNSDCWFTITTEVFVDPPVDPPVDEDDPELEERLISAVFHKMAEVGFSSTTGAAWRFVLEEVEELQY